MKWTLLALACLLVACRPAVMVPAGRHVITVSVVHAGQPVPQALISEGGTAPHGRTDTHGHLALVLADQSVVICARRDHTPNICETVNLTANCTITLELP